MMDALLLAGQRLAEALRAENEALAALDLTRAANLAASKIAAADAFAAAYAAQSKCHASLAAAQREAAESLARRLDTLGQENRRLLERAIALQSRVIETIAAAALPRSVPTAYAPPGRRPSTAKPSAALALSARV